MKKYLDKWFGIRVAIVTAESLRSYMKCTQKFVFPADTSELKIKASVSWFKDGCFRDFSITDVQICRRKDIQMPPENRFTLLPKSREIYYYD